MKYFTDSEFKNRLKEFNNLLSQEPEHSEPSEDGTYLLVPIAFLEPDLNFIYDGAINIKIREQKEMFGAVCMFIDLEVFHPIFEIWQTFSGTAAVVIESEKPGDYKGSSKVLVTENIRTAIASCYTECIKNAAKKIGIRFGKDLNRTSKPSNKMIKTKRSQEEIQAERLTHLINDCSTIKELMNIKKNVPVNLNDLFNQRFIELGDSQNG